MLKLYNCEIRKEQRIPVRVIARSLKEATELIRSGEGDAGDAYFHESEDLICLRAEAVASDD